MPFKINISEKDGKTFHMDLDSESLFGKENVLFSAITETELIAGQSCENNDIKNKVLQMLNSFHKREVTNRVALVAGDLCRRYGVDLPDGIIAATAIINKSELFTKNLKDFQKIEGLKVVAPY